MHVRRDRWPARPAIRHHNDRIVDSNLGMCQFAIWAGEAAQLFCVKYTDQKLNGFLGAIYDQIRGNRCISIGLIGASSSFSIMSSRLLMGRAN